MKVYVPLSDDEAREQLGEGIHTAMRKGVDHAGAVEVHRLIGEAPWWGDAIGWAVWALGSMGLRLCREEERENDHER